MIAFIITILKLLVILGIVATIHEFGHFLASKWFKVGVNEFSIGFGPKIFQRRYKETMYSLRWIPLGGYVSIEGEDGESDTEGSFARKNAFQKIVILSMGVIFNAVLASVIFIGIALSNPTHTTNIIEFAQNSAAYNAGLRQGDTITEVNGEKVTFGNELRAKKIDNKGDIVVKYDRDSKNYETTVNEAKKEIGYIGTSFAFSKDKQYSTNEIEMVSAGSSASSAKLKAGDIITSINGVKTDTAKEIVTIIQSSPNQDLEILVDRKGEQLKFNLKPVAEEILDLGIVDTKEQKTTIGLAMQSAIANSKNIIGSYVDLFKGKVNINQMSGIVGIGEVVSKTNNLLEFLNLMAVISLAIGIANIMPFPPLDGGKIVIVLFETITRKKVSYKTEAIISYIGFALLIGLTIFVTYNDLIRII